MKAYPTAKEARDIANENKETPDLDHFFQWVNDQSRKGETFGKYTLPGDKQHFSDKDLQFIVAQGYYVYWNSPCLWYEIGWGR